MPAFITKAQFQQALFHHWATQEVKDISPTEQAWIRNKCKNQQLSESHCAHLAAAIAFCKKMYGQKAAYEVIKGHPSTEALHDNFTLLQESLNTYTTSPNIRVKAQHQSQPLAELGFLRKAYIYDGEKLTWEGKTLTTTGCSFNKGMELWQTFKARHGTGHTLLLRVNKPSRQAGLINGFLLAAFRDGFTGPIQIKTDQGKSILPLDAQGNIQMSKGRYTDHYYHRSSSWPIVPTVTPMQAALHMLAYQRDVYRDLDLASGTPKSPAINQAILWKILKDPASTPAQKEGFLKHYLGSTITPLVRLQLLYAIETETLGINDSPYGSLILKTLKKPLATRRRSLQYDQDSNCFTYQGKAWASDKGWMDMLKKADIGGLGSKAANMIPGMGLFLDRKHVQQSGTHHDFITAQTAEESVLVYSTLLNTLRHGTEQEQWRVLSTIDHTITYQNMTEKKQVIYQNIVRVLRPCCDNVSAFDSLYAQSSTLPPQAQTLRNQPRYAIDLSKQALYEGELRALEEKLTGKQPSTKLTLLSEAEKDAFDAPLTPKSTQLLLQASARLRKQLACTLSNGQKPIQLKNYTAWCDELKKLAQNDNSLLFSPQERNMIKKENTANPSYQLWPLIMRIALQHHHTNNAQSDPSARNRDAALVVQSIHMLHRKHTDQSTHRSVSTPKTWLDKPVDFTTPTPVTPQIM